MTFAAALGDVLEMVIDHRGKTPKKLGGDWTASGHRVVSALNIKGSLIDDNDHHYISDEMYKKWMSNPLRGGDVLLTSEAPLGEVAFLSEDVDWALGQRLFALRSKSDVLDGRYLFYLLKGGKPRDELMARATGTTVLGIRQAELIKIMVEIPPLDEQREISATLGALDDKIESNRRTIEKLLALGSALYEGALSSGSREVTVGEIADFHNRRRIPLSSMEREARPGDIPYYGATGIFGYVDDYLFDEVLVLVGEDGTVVRDDGGPVTQYIWGKTWINNHAHPLTGRGISNELLFLALDRSDIRPLVTGAVQPKVSMGNLKSLAIDLPNEIEQARLESLLSSLFAVLRCRSDEVLCLEQLRDTLLPGLLSGRCRGLRAYEKGNGDIV